MPLLASTPIPIILNASCEIKNHNEYVNSVINFCGYAGPNGFDENSEFLNAAIGAHTHTDNT